MDSKVVLSQVFSKEDIEEAVSKLGQQITIDFRRREFVVICIANGGVYFAVDLTRKIEVPHRFDCLLASSYHKNIRLNGVSLDIKLKEPIDGKSVLVIDDVLDSGNTLRTIKQELCRLGAADVKTAVFLQKKIKDRDFSSDYFCFEVEDFYAIGYGMDDCGLYRNLNFLGKKKGGA